MVLAWELEEKGGPDLGLRGPIWALGAGSSHGCPLERVTPLRAVLVLAGGGGLLQCFVRVGDGRWPLFSQPCGVSEHDGWVLRWRRCEATWTVLPQSLEVWR